MVNDQLKEVHRLQRRLMSEHYHRALEAMGCAYELFNTAYLVDGWGALGSEDLLDAAGRPIPRLAEPDILLACDNQCRVICEWFHHLSEIYGNKPYRMINVGDRFDGSFDKIRQDYVRKQLEDLILSLQP